MPSLTPPPPGFSARWLAAATLTVLVCAWAPAHAATVTTPPVLTLSCTALDVTTQGVFNRDRDTSGTGQETVQFQVLDGAGTVLISDGGTSAIGSNLTLALGTSPYATAPTYNPLTFRITSPAGNGLPEQVVYTTTGSCAGLPMAPTAAVPTLEVWGLGLLALAAGGLGAGQLRPRRGRGAEQSRDEAA